MDASGFQARWAKEAHLYSPSDEIMIKEILTKHKPAAVRAVVPATEPLNSDVCQELPKARSYLIEEEKAKAAFELFTSLVTGRCSNCDCMDSFPCESIGCEDCQISCSCKSCRSFRAQGLCFTMRFPQEIRLAYALQTTPIFWISSHGPQSINPADLEAIADIAIKYLNRSRNAVILLDGIEHLIFENGPARVLRLLRDIEEHVMLQRAVLILPVNPNALDEKELALIKRNTVELQRNEIYLNEI